MPVTQIGITSCPSHNLQLTFIHTQFRMHQNWFNLRNQWWCRKTEVIDSNTLYSPNWLSLTKQESINLFTEFAESFTPMRDQDIIYPHSIDTISSRQVTRELSLIQHIILITNFVRNIWQTERRIFFEIVAVNGLYLIDKRCSYLYFEVEKRNLK